MTTAHEPPFCCFIPAENQEAVKTATREEIATLRCQQQVRWRLTFNASPDGQIDSCENHVGELLGDDPLIDIEDLAKW